MNIGIIASSNGSVFIEVFKCLNKVSPNKYKFFVILDRETDLIKFCQDNDIFYSLITEKENDSFSIKAKELFLEKGVNTVFLFFLRLVTKEIYDNFTTLNIHPSLLPSFRGFNAIENAINSNFKFLGATLHKVDETIDGGKILIQTAKILEKTSNVNKISFLQKVLLMLIYFDFLESKLDLETIDNCKFNSNTTSPFFNLHKFKKFFSEIEKNENNKVSNA